MDAVRRTTTVRQMELLVEFAEAHRDLALGRLRSKEARALAVRLWRECAQILNSEGPARTHREWSKVWNDTKCRVKAKLTAAAVPRRGTGGGPFINVVLSAIEEKVAEITGRDIGPLPNCGQEQLADATNDEEDDTTVDSFIDRDVLDESRAMVLRIEEMRARTDSVLAEAALIAAQAAKSQAEASLLQSRAVESFILNMMPAVRLFIQTLTRREQETTEAETSNLINT